MQTFDPKVSCVATSSGRVYRLDGPSLFDDGADDFLVYWLAKSG